MSVLINQQDETIGAIETVAARVEDDTGRGYVSLPVIMICYSPGSVDFKRRRRQCNMRGRHDANVGTASSYSFSSSPSSESLSVSSLARRINAKQNSTPSVSFTHPTRSISIHHLSRCNYVLPLVHHSSSFRGLTGLSDNSSDCRRMYGKVTCSRTLFSVPIHTSLFRSVVI